ncbi:hypothetical protein [Adhaeribacter pallidiroseus]|uniref:DUF2939 domain-containing protein n=1 Tax=Adhaeribacter pallidiroseus TaxID=2072847 RepID=A0A369QKD3_9BACT|nr:hypothetical protein [Adhaeribacter pallidiroseus]RDC65194.1 hypothetical protein AHMF7616_03824 [Adhaeribacter pallidiroseus]
MKKVVWILVVVVLIGGYTYYRNLVRSPKYSLLQAHEALQDHDMAAFEKYVNVESITTDLVNDMSRQKSLIGLLNPGSMVLKQAIQFMKPQLASVARKEVQKYVETGSFAKDPTREKKVDISLNGLWNKVVSDSSQFKGVNYTREEGETAFVGLEFTQPRYDTTFVLEVKMQNKGDYWQATEITNTSDIFKGIARLQKQRLQNKLLD